jgi:hypothetical protein
MLRMQYTLSTKGYTSGIVKWMAHHIIYVPGLGDHKTYGQNFGIQVWRMFGFVPHYFPLGWANKEGFDKKLDRLLKQIDALRNQGHAVSLVGVSAGASAVLNAYNEREQIIRVVCICGKIQHPGTVRPSRYRSNPDYRESMRRVSRSLELLKTKSLLENIMSIHPLRDKSVPLGDTKIAGAVEKTVPGWSHATGVIIGVIIGAPLISKFLHSARSQH